MSNLKKFKFDFDLSGLQAYTEQRSSSLISESIMTGDFASQVVVIPNVKGTQELNVLASNLVSTAGGCGWAPNSGTTTTFTQKSITSVKRQYQEALCIDDLEGYWYQTLLKPGQYYDSPSDIPFEEAIMSYKVKQAKEAIELELFQATSGGTGFDGFLELTGSGYTGSNVSCVAAASGVTSSNIGNSVDLLLADLPDAVYAADDTAVFMSYGLFRNYTVWVREKNYFYLNNPGNGVTSILHPGTSIQVIPVHGLTGSNRIFTTRKSNLFIGTDLVSDYSQFKAWYSLDNQEVRIKLQWRMGAQTGVDQISSNCLA